MVLARPEQLKAKPQNIDGIKFGSCYADHVSFIRLTMLIS